MNKEKLPKLYKREWLNTTDGSGYFIIHAEVDEVWNYEGGRSLDADIEIKDCNRQIKLDFYAYNIKEYKERLKKLQKMIDAFQELKEFMVKNPPVKGTKKKKDKTKSVNMDYIRSLGLVEDEEETNTVNETMAPKKT